jgi:hypothetical protein
MLLLLMRFIGMKRLELIALKVILVWYLLLALMMMISLKMQNHMSFLSSNVNKIPSPRDLKMRDTVMLIIENFFNMNEAALLYICESGDGKQHMRSRLFEYWFSSYQMKDKFILMPVSIEDMEGIENFAALIIRKDNPNVLDIVAEFSNTVAMFRVKPNSHD